MALLGLWNKTYCAVRRLGLEDDMYQERPIIHRDSRVDGGVYLGGGQREAIIVDSKDSRIQQLYDRAKRKITINGVVIKDHLLRSVYESVAEAMPIQNSDSVRKLVRNNNVENDGKISLGFFLEAGIGVCRHDALACAVLLELFRKEGHINGKPSVDRNSFVFGGHAWWTCLV